MPDKYDYKLLPNLTNDQMRVLASDIRSDILVNVLNNGGHLSSNLGTVELTMSLLKNFDPLVDDILFDVGHQTYTYKILTGRNLSKLRKTNGIAPFSKMDESPYDKSNNGHAGSAISLAYGLAKAKALKGDNSYTIAFIGDASVTNGLSMEALNLLSTDKDVHLMIVVNDNGMSISKNVGFMTKKFQHLRTSRFYFRTASYLGRKMSKHKWSWRLFLRMRNLKDDIRRFVIEPTFFESMGIKYIGPFDGHDFDSLDLAFAKAKDLYNKGPVVVHVLTKKGYGYAPAMSDNVGKYHGVTPKFDNIWIQNNKKTGFVDYKSSFLMKKMKEDKNVYVITPAMEKGSQLEEIFKAFPERTLDVGIAEENAVSMAGGLALGGLKPVVDIYSTFMQRSFDEIEQDISRQKVKALFVVERCGLVGEDGSSHQGLYDVAMVKAIPNCQVYMPYDEKTTEELLNAHFFSDEGLVFIRFSTDSPIHSHLSYKRIGNICYYRLAEENDTLVLAIGPNGYKLLELLPDSFDKGMLLTLIHPGDKQDSMPTIMRHKHIILYDSYGIKEGTSDSIASYLMENNYPGTFKSFAFKNNFVTFGQKADLLKIANLDPQSVKDQILLPLEKKPAEDK